MKTNLPTILLMCLVLCNKSSNGDKDPSSSVKKPFGIGIGRVFIGGRDTGEEGTNVALTIYSQYRQFLRLTKQNVNEEYYQR